MKIEKGTVPLLDGSRQREFQKGIKGKLIGRWYKMSDRNPYVRGNYRLAFAWMQKQGTFTRSALVKHFMTLVNGKGKKLNEAQAEASATVLLSPREASKRGDCRGNCSAMGHLYFVQSMKKVEGEEMKFKLHYRKEALKRHVRKDVTGKAPKGKKNQKKVQKKVQKTKKVAKVVKPVAKKVQKKVAKVVKKAVKVEAPVAPPVEAPAAVVVPEAPVAPVEASAAPEAPAAS